MTEVTENDTSYKYVALSGRSVSRTISEIPWNFDPQAKIPLMVFYETQVNDSNNNFSLIIQYCNTM